MGGMGSGGNRSMGGIGSGGHNNRGRIAAEVLDRLDIRQAENRRRLDPGSASLTYTNPTVTQVALKWRRCRFGGSRPFLVCPRCLRLCLVLYVWGGHLLCRVCARVAYASQLERERERSWRAARKLRRRLGQESSHVDPIPDRPHGMWQRTYDRVVQRIVALEGAALRTAKGRGSSRYCGLTEGRRHVRLRSSSSRPAPATAG